MDSGKKASIANIKSFYSEWRGMDSGLVGIFATIIIGTFPFTLKDYYFDILNFKTFFYYKIVIIFTVVLLMVNVIFLILSIYPNCDRSTGRGRKICAFDWSMLDFILIVGISTLQSATPAVTLLGNGGRYSDLLIWIAYAFIYFAIRRGLHLRQWYLDLFLGAGMGAYVIEILQYSDMDPIGFKNLMDLG